MSHGSLKRKIRFLGQKCALKLVNRRTDMKVNTEDTFSGFQEFLLHPIIKNQFNS